MIATRRLKVEFVKLQKDPVPLAIAAPLEKNVLEWRFVIKGIGLYEGGFYQGKFVFPPEYPLKPPSILFITPNGRFEVNKRICLSISDYHPESWTPSWTVGTILTGVVSFFNGDEYTVGALKDVKDSQKIQLASTSMAFNQRDKIFVSLFGTDPTILFDEMEAKLAAITQSRVLKNAEDNPEQQVVNDTVLTNESSAEALCDVSNNINTIEAPDELQLKDNQSLLPISSTPSSIIKDNYSLSSTNQDNFKNLNISDKP